MEIAPASPLMADPVVILTAPDELPLASPVRTLTEPVLPTPADDPV